MKIISWITFSLLCKLSCAIDIYSIYQYLKTVDNGVYARYDGITYAAPTINNLSSDDQQWLLQTPNIWGNSLDQYNYSESFSRTGQYDHDFNLPLCATNSDCGPLAKCSTAFFTLNNESLCLMPEHNVLNTMATNIINANYTVDITALGEKGEDGLTTPTTGRFSLTIKNALQKLALKSITSGKIIKVRILEGSANIFLAHDLNLYLLFLTQDLPAHNNLEIQVGSVLTCTLVTCHNENPLLDFSSSHAKTVNIDGTNLIEGGENFWDEEYLGNNPTNDLDINIEGPVASLATTYSNILWQYLINHPKLGSDYCYTYSNGKIIPQCLIPYIGQQGIASNYSGIKVVAMPNSELDGNLLDDSSEQSELIRVYAFLNAESSIKISQQAIFWRDTTLPNSIFPPKNTIDGNVIDALATAIHLHNVNVSIVTSNFKNGSIFFLVNQKYNSFVPLQYIKNSIQNAIVANFKVTTTEATNETNQLLHLAYIDFNHSNNSTINMRIIIKFPG